MPGGGGKTGLGALEGGSGDGLCVLVGGARGTEVFAVGVSYI